MKLSFVLFVLLSCTLCLAPSGANPGNGIVAPSQGENGKGNGPPEFLSDDDLPPGLSDNPSETVGVRFKADKKPKAQKLPAPGKKGTTIRGLDNQPIHLDLDKAETVNMFHPDRYTPSEDGASVTDNETGEVIPLAVYYIHDEKKGNDILFSMGVNNFPIHVIVSPKGKSEGNIDDIRGNIQNFQLLEGTDILVGYTDEDLDMEDVPSDVEPSEPDKEEWIPPLDAGEEGGRRTEEIEAFIDVMESYGAKPDNASHLRRAQATWSRTAYGRTCNRWDYLDVNIVTDAAFKSKFGTNYKNVAQMIFAVAQKIYWEDACIYLYMWRFENTAGNSAWRYGGTGTHIDWYLSQSYYDSSGCGSNFGHIDLLRAFCKKNFDSTYRDLWHMITSRPWSKDGAAGCGFINVCKNKDYGYGVERTWTTNVDIIGKHLAHEVGHNLGLGHLSQRTGYWVMEQGGFKATSGFWTSNADVIRNKVVESSSCGWY